VAVLAGLVVVAMLVGCVSTGVWLLVSHRHDTRPPDALRGSAPARESPRHPATPSHSALAGHSVSPSATASARLTGLGATQMYWQAHHKADPTFLNAYDPDPSLPPIGGHPGPRYVEVTFAGGLVSTYTLRFPRGTSSTDALTQVRDQFPADATIMWHTTYPQYSLTELSSPTLGRTMGAADGDTLGRIMVVFDSDAETGDSYRPGDVYEAMMQLTNDTTASDENGC
jgi:hypothetical protein